MLWLQTRLPLSLPAPCERPSHLQTPTTADRRTHVIVVLLDDGFVQAVGLLVLVLHEENVRHVQLPGVVLVADIHGLAEDLLHHLKIFSVPVDLGLSHEDHDVPGGKYGDKGFCDVRVENKP